MGLWALLLPMIGFFVTSLAGFLGLNAIATFERPGIRTLITSAIVAVAVVGAFQLLMANVLLLRMPAGLLF